ncbi:MAG: hypothetical protein MUF23_09240 [Pirellula sp.]|nr:hypothetical protein [Pirellula sp.]
MSISEIRNTKVLCAPYRAIGRPKWSVGILIPTDVSLAFAGILLLLILLVQGVFFSYQSMTYSIGSDKPVTTQSYYGVGTPITVTIVNGVTKRDIRLCGIVISTMRESEIRQFAFEESHSENEHG